MVRVKYDTVSKQIFLGNQRLSARLNAQARSEPRPAKAGRGRRPKAAG
jgi:hypothetical protein